MNRLYQKHVHMSGTVDSKAAEMWWKICLAVVGHQFPVSHEPIRTILNDCLGMKRVTARLVPEDLNFIRNFNRIKAKNSTNIIEQPQYSPDMAPADCFLFPKLKLPLRGARFQSIEDIKKNSRRVLKSVPENAFKKCFNDWIIGWNKCIISGGAHFGGDKINLDVLDL